MFEERKPWLLCQHCHYSPMGQQLPNEGGPGDTAGPLPEVEKAQGTSKPSLALRSLAEGPHAWGDVGCPVASP